MIPWVECLEERNLLSVLLQIGTQQQFSYRDADGDLVTLRIAGSAGQVAVLEDQLDTFGDNDGILEDGENAGVLRITGASADFTLNATAVGTGNGSVQLGEVSAIDQAIRGLFTAGPLHFNLKSFHGWDFAPGGGLQVDDISEELVLANLSAGAAIDIRGNLDGKLLVKDSLQGLVHIGGDWRGDAIIGQGLSGALHVGGDVAGDVEIIGDHSGEAQIGGNFLGEWLIVGGLTGRLQAGGTLDSLRVVDDLHGIVSAGQGLRLDVGTSVGSTGLIQGNDVTLYVGGSFSGWSIAQRTGYAHIIGDISSSAWIQGSASLMVEYGSTIDAGATLTSPNQSLVYLPEQAQGQIIDRLPFVITSSGLYRLSQDLDYTGAAGNAIEVRASDVTIDLQGYTLRNTAGSSTEAVGIAGYNLSSVVVQNGTISGFRFGVILNGSEGRSYRVEKVRADSNWYFGLWVEGADSLTRNNVIWNSGGLVAGPEWSVVISLRALGAGHRVEDNIIYGFHRSPNNLEWVGAHLDAAPSASFLNNIIAAPILEANAWGLWVNLAAWPGFGSTSLDIDGNLFDNLGTAVWVQTGAGLPSFTNNALLDTDSPLEAASSTETADLTGNFFFCTDLRPEVPAVPLTDLGELMRSYGFHPTETYYFNDMGKFEKWFLDRQQRWYAVLPDGSLWFWTSGSLSNATLIGHVHPDVWDYPTRLFKAPVALTPSSQTLLQQLRREYGFHFSEDYYLNWAGQGEKWFLDRQGRWFALLPNGSLRLWAGDRSLSASPQVAVVDRLVYEDPSLLFNAPVSLSAASQAVVEQLRQRYGFHFSGDYYLNWAGLGEKCFQDRQGRWFALLPSGSLRQWAGDHKLSASPQVAVVDPLVFDDPTLLF